MAPPVQQLQPPSIHRNDEDEVPSCAEERETLRMHARAIATTATVLAAGVTVVFVVVLAWLLQPLRWPSTTGTVEFSMWFTGTADDSHGASMTYTYEVNGETYQSRQLSLFRWGGRANAGSGQWEWDERALVEQHRRGDAIEVFYDPNDHARAVVVAHANMPGVWIGGAIVALFWGMAIECIRRSRGPLTPRMVEESGWRWGHPD